ncbi:gp044 (endogenous virus) [Lactococcus phage KSY1]|uniref:Gp044 n=1 Tax=Lactococcus phage KSY1 TaxID=2913972 RepID=A6MAA8_9CAUD|nr:gp044 [Lactococcus phage KSY1]ABG21586.1 gp044 [Lactococcus phage KSY1]
MNKFDFTVYAKIKAKRDEAVKDLRKINLSTDKSVDRTAEISAITSLISALNAQLQEIVYG